MEKYTKLYETILAKKDELNFHQIGFCEMKDVSVNEGVRQLCEMNSCGWYGRSWACPPAVGTYEECVEKLKKYKDVFVFTTKHDLEDSYDFEGMMDGKDRHGEIADEVRKFFVDLVPGDKLCLCNDGCTKCKKCSYPDEPCRFPDEMFPSVESYGMEVNRLAASVGVNYINGANTVTYFGCICFNMED